MEAKTVEGGEAREAFANHFAKVGHMFLPGRDAARRAVSVLCAASVALSIAASAMGPAAAAQPSDVAAALAAPTSAIEMVDGGVNLRAPLTPERASLVIDGLRDSLHREMPESVGRIEFINPFAKDIKVEAARVSDALGVPHGSPLEGNVERIDGILKSGSTIRGLSASFKADGSPMADTSEADAKVCVVGAGVQSTDATGAWTAYIAHEVGHCIQSLKYGHVMGLDGDAADAAAVAQGAGGEYQVESFAHRLMIGNGAGTDWMKNRIAVTDALPGKDDNAAALGYQMAPMYQHILSETGTAKATQLFYPGRLAGFEGYFTAATADSAKYTPTADALEGAALAQRVDNVVSGMLASSHGGDVKNQEYRAALNGWRAAMAKSNPFFAEMVGGLAAANHFSATGQIDISYRDALPAYGAKENVVRTYQDVTAWVRTAPPGVTPDMVSSLLHRSLRVAAGSDETATTLANRLSSVSVNSPQGADAIAADALRDIGHGMAQAPASPTPAPSAAPVLLAAGHDLTFSEHGAAAHEEMAQRQDAAVHQAFEGGVGRMEVERNGVRLTYLVSIDDGRETRRLHNDEGYAVLGPEGHRVAMLNGQPAVVVEALVPGDRVAISRLMTKDDADTALVRGEFGPEAIAVGPTEKHFAALAAARKAGVDSPLVTLDGKAWAPGADWRP